MTMRVSAQPENIENTDAKAPSCVGVQVFHRFLLHSHDPDGSTRLLRGLQLVSLDVTVRVRRRTGRLEADSVNL